MMDTDLSDDPEENYARFIAESIDTGCVWTLEGPEGFALSPSADNDDINVIPFWSQPEFAERHCVDEWKTYRSVPIALEELLDDWLPGMHSDLVMAGINWNDDMEGVEIEPLDLVEDIDNEAKENP